MHGGGKQEWKSEEKGGRTERVTELRAAGRPYLWDKVSGLSAKLCKNHGHSVLDNHDYLHRRQPGAQTARSSLAGAAGAQAAPQGPGLTSSRALLTGRLGGECYQWVSRQRSSKQLKRVG